MRILQVIPYLDKRLGGDVAVCYNLTTGLRKRGHHVTICTSELLDPELKKAAAANGIEVISMLSSIKIAGMIVTPQMGEWIQGRLADFDIAHLHGYRTYQNVVVDKYLSRQGVPFVLQSHGSYPRIVERKAIKAIYDLVWGRRIANHCEKAVAVSDVERRQYILGGIAEEKIEVIPNGVEVDRFVATPERGIFRSKHQLGKGKLLLYLGRIHRSKGLAILLDAFASVRSTGLECKLAFVGSDGGHREWLKTRARGLGVGDSIVFVDHTDHPEEAYVDADLVVYPSPYEIFGLVPFEAMMCFTPVIVAEGTGCGEIVKNNNLGYTFDPRNAEELARSIIRALNDPEGGRQMAIRGREFTLRHLTWDHVTDRFEKAYESCLSTQQKLG